MIFLRCKACGKDELSTDNGLLPDGTCSEGCSIHLKLSTALGGGALIPLPMFPQELKKLPPQDLAVGFTEAEDGSQRRYWFRKVKAKAWPWWRHPLWWFVHNVVAHPLIGIFPLGFLFKFHDWTSRKMHGR